MPITEDILDHDIIGPTAKAAALEVLRPLIEERSGPIPEWAEERLTGMHPRAVIALGGVCFTPRAWKNSCNSAHTGQRSPPYWIATVIPVWLL
jgi:hypothetical protein